MSEELPYYDPTPMMDDPSLEYGFFQDVKPFYTTAEVAELHRVSVDTVYNYIKNGVLEAKKVGRSWHIDSLSARTVKLRAKRMSGTNRVTLNVSDELKVVIEAHKAKINQSAIFEAGAWLILAEVMPNITYTYATNMARLALGRAAIVESAVESAVATVA